MDNRQIREEYAELAAEVISENAGLFDDIKKSNATIIYLGSDYAKTSKGKAVLGECEKVANKNKWAIPCDFTITVYEPNCLGMTRDQMKILLFHELLHVGIKYEDDGSEKYYIRPHDYEDFKIVIDRYGTDWSKT
jgi:hypothetical protein